VAQALAQTTTQEVREPPLIMPPEVLITLPIVLVALLRFSDVSVKLAKARDGASAWYFRFSPRTVLRVQEDGEWAWVSASERWRRRIAPVLARAERLLAADGRASIKTAAE
jgi:hypothetical protein